MEGGADVLLIETCFDTGSLKAGLVAVDQLRRDLGMAIPVMVSVTIERNGTMLGGQAMDALYASIANQDLLAVGMNCATGPDLMTDHIADAQRDVRVSDLVLSERGAAQLGGQVRGDARIACGAAGAVRRTTAG